MEIGDAVRGYLALASGLTEVTRERAKAAAQSLAAQSEQAGALAEDLWRTSRANRVAMVELIRQETERVLRRAGLASADRLRDLEARLRSVERQLATARTATRPTAGKSTATKSTAKKSTATRTTARKTTAKRTTAKRTTAGKTTAKRTTAKRAAAKKSSGA